MLVMRLTCTETYFYFYQSSVSQSEIAKFFRVRKDFNATICLSCHFCLNTYVEFVKSDHRNKCASPSRLFFAYTVIYYVQYIALELPLQISQHTKIIGTVCIRSRNLKSRYIFPSSDHRCAFQSVSFIIHNFARLLSKSDMK